MICSFVTCFKFLVRHVIAPLLNYPNIKNTTYHSSVVFSTSINYIAL